MHDFGWGTTLLPPKPSPDRYQPMSAADLSERLAVFALAITAAARTMPRDFVGAEIAGQIVRSAMSSGAHYSEARESTTSRDYAFKVSMCLRELRETAHWLRLARGNGFRNANYEDLERECSELIAISITCAKNAKASAQRSKGRRARRP
jgi:four helix bundle protein